MSAFWWAVVTACIWGIVPLMEKIGLRESQPTVGVFARSLGVVLGTLILGLVWSPWKALGRLPIGSFLLLAAGGFLASFVGQMVFYRALKAGEASQVTPIAGAYPLVAALLGWWLLREPMTPARGGGIACIILGIWLLSR